MGRSEDHNKIVGEQEIADQGIDFLCLKASALPQRLWSFI
jgi:hypothetical protein